MCEYGHGLDTFDTHLTGCPFGGQWIATHDTIRDVMYAFVRESGHVVWREGGTPLCHEFHYELLWVEIMAPNHYHPLGGKTKG
jgi:hypothetical protein